MQNATNHAAAPVSDDERLQAAWNQLNLVLGFFDRVDTRLGAVLALDLGMLALAGSRWPSPEDLSWRIAIAALIFVLPLCASIYHLWNALVPDRKGGANSLVFFRRIASMRESEFVEGFTALSSAQLTSELLEQAWRNSKVLDCKFDALRNACIGMAMAVVPWVWLLVELSQEVPG